MLQLSGAGMTSYKCPVVTLYYLIYKINGQSLHRKLITH